ncbi:ubiquitin-like-specific protease ESD4 [Ananas comosus]|uniref:Ubiquitin-like-specific protease ESD4 n=1 Tax=Ananas comosus TaxID=4615 RepID=A0A6P5EML7_ANACO|nr:ubiquitin-like-specific protease ESD4 [Ananas comosus]
MGALTDNRKRRFGDHKSLPSASSPASLVLPPPMAKRMKTTPTPPPLDDGPPPPSPAMPPPNLDSSRAAPSSLRRFPPPAAPLPRAVHAPQRSIKAFGLGLLNSRRSRPPEPSLAKERDSDKWSPPLQFLSAKKAAPFSSSVPQKSFEEEAEAEGWGLGLEQYKRLVDSVQNGHSVASDLVSVKTRFPPSQSITVSELTNKSSLVVRQRVEDERKKVSLELSPVRELSSVRKVPLYKELYEDSVRKHDSRLRDLEFEVKLAEKNVTSFQLLKEVLDSMPTKELREPFTPLTNEEENVVDSALDGANSREELVTHESSNIVITREILQCLRYGAWLNDEVINLYLELLKERERSQPNKFLKCQFFNTFFNKKLISGSNGYDFKAVRRWTTQRKLGYSLIECDKIFVPIHKEIHWCLAVVDVKDKKFQYLDSLGGIDIMVLRVLARYLMDEVKDKNAKQIDTSSRKQEVVDNLPLQKNGWDCGMFMLKYADFYSRGLSLSFKQDDMTYFRRRTAKEILQLRAE